MAHLTQEDPRELEQATVEVPVLTDEQLQAAIELADRIGEFTDDVYSVLGELASAIARATGASSSPVRAPERRTRTARSLVGLVARKTGDTPRSMLEAEFMNAPNDDLNDDFWRASLAGHPVSAGTRSPTFAVPGATPAGVGAPQPPRPLPEGTPPQWSGSPNSRRPLQGPPDR